MKDPLIGLSIIPTIPVEHFAVGLIFSGKGLTE